ncbi:hypothetical protein [Pseudomonas leptonychotis]|uniref:hypothetical protein n=1 Tax=Pseudomonas leptonychotis TaxID=2448482 RepID=UPI0039EDE98E
MLAYFLIAATLSLMIAAGLNAFDGEVLHKSRHSSKTHAITIATPIFFILLLLLKFTVLGGLLVAGFASLKTIGKPSRRVRLHNIYLKKALLRFNKKSYAEAHSYFSQANSLKTLSPSNEHLKEIARIRAAGKSNSN